MKTAKGNIWTYPCDYKVITTNGCVKKNGEAVMGRGVAAQAKGWFKGLPRELGGMIRAYGNKVYIFNDYKIITFPVKYNWYEAASMYLIRRSCIQLQTSEKIPEDCIVAMPRPGCGNGQLSWDIVGPMIFDMLDDRFVVLEYIHDFGRGKWKD